MEVVVPFLLILVGFALLTKGADLFIDGATQVSLRLSVPEYAIGATVVAFGTSLPEASTSVYAAWIGAQDIALSNVVGSNMCNIALVLGVAAMIRTVRVSRHIFEKDAPTFLMAALLLFVVSADLRMTRLEGSIFLLLLLAYVAQLFQDQDTSVDGVTLVSPWRTGLDLAGGFFGFVVGTHMLVDSAVKIAKICGVSEWVIGLTVVALGTSLPELVTTVVASLKGRSGLAVGNVVGSNIFNTYFVLGLASCVDPISLDVVTLRFDLVVNLALSFALMIMLYGKTLTRENGITLVGAYVLILLTSYGLHH